MTKRDTPTAARVSRRGRANEGRPSKFQPWMTGVGAKLATLGATTPDLADAFDVEVSTVNLWLKSNLAFSDAVRSAKAQADVAVERRLFERATGYEHETEEIFCHGGKVTRVPTRKRFPPDTNAASFWLRNRKPDQWRERQQLELSGPNGGPIQTNQTDEQMIVQLVAVAGQNPMVKHKLCETLRRALEALSYAPA